jgi:hypothetical protein
MNTAPEMPSSSKVCSSDQPRAAANVSASPRWTATDFNSACLSFSSFDFLK